MISASLSFVAMSSWNPNGVWGSRGSFFTSSTAPTPHKAHRYTDCASVRSAEPRTAFWRRCNVGTTRRRSMREGDSPKSSTCSLEEAALVPCHSAGCTLQLCSHTAYVRPRTHAARAPATLSGPLRPADVTSAGAWLSPLVASKWAKNIQFATCIQSLSRSKEFSDLNKLFSVVSLTAVPLPSF